MNKPRNRWHFDMSRLAAVATAAMGIINVLSASTPAMHERMVLLAAISPLEVRAGSNLTAVLAGFALLLLARGLWRHKRAAWILTIAVLSLSIIAHMLKGLDYEEATLAALLLGFLWMQRKHFNALSDPPSLRQGIAILLVAIFFTLAYGIIGFYLLDSHFHVNFNLWDAVRQTLVMFTAFYDPGLQPLTGFGRYFAASIYVVGATTIGYALWKMLRPVLAHQPATDHSRQQAQKIVEQYGKSSLARFVLFRDKHYWFSPGGSVIAYATHRHTALALGDPIGPSEDAAATIAGFHDFCARNDWAAAYYQTQPDYLDQYRGAGYEVLCIGHEGIVNLTTFTLSGGSNKTLRSTMNRLSKSGFRAEVYEPPIDATLIASLRDISDEWLAKVSGKEKRFSLGWFDEEYLRSAPIMVIHTPDDSIMAFANLVTEYTHNQISIDMMRHRNRIENGIMDFLFISLFQWASAKGYDTFNLGLSALSGLGTEPDDPAIERALHYIYEHVNQFYNFKGLHEFKEKFHPDWSPRYLIFSSYAALPAIAFTLERASSGPDFLLDYAVGAWGYLRGALQSWRERKEAQPAKAQAETEKPASTSKADTTI